MTAKPKLKPPKKPRIPTGPDSPHWKGGNKRWIYRHFPKRLIGRFHAIINDPDLVSVRSLLAVTSVRLTELFEKLETRESRQAWDELKDLLPQLKLFVPPDEDQAAQFLGLVQALQLRVKAARAERELWDELHGTIERARRLAKTEHEREAALQANLTAQQAIALFNRLFQVITEEIRDTALRARVALRLQQLMMHDGEGQPASRLLPRATPAFIPPAQEPAT